MGGPSPPHRSAALNLILTHSGDFLRGHGEGVSGLYPCPRPSPPSAPIVTAEPGFQDHISVGVETTREQPFSGCGGGGRKKLGDKKETGPTEPPFGKPAVTCGPAGIGGVTPVPRMFGDGETSLSRPSSLWGSLGGFWGPMRPQ